MEAITVQKERDNKPLHIISALFSSFNLHNPSGRRMSTGITG
jgi:hypothetical protein